jgi:CheY-like chemotaxis protein
MEKMMRRLIGEDVELVTDCRDEDALVMVDAGQIEQVLMNLAVNARDAMPAGGRLSIQTAAVGPEAVAVLGHGPRPPGWVRVSVTDSGTGMDPATLERIFEPFFTTKGEGKGTGLGLATVYGIVTQSGGHIEVESAPGRGTTFSIFFPAVAAALPGAEEERRRALPEGGTETVLVVEDQDTLRAMVKETLRNLGYSVLDAPGAEDATEVSRVFDGPIHLLLTDCVMPRTSGVELAEALRRERPEMKVLFMSGYPGEEIARHGEFLEGGAFLAKPFHAEALAAQVREVLGRGVSPPRRPAGVPA